MSTDEHVFIYAGLPAIEVAERLAEALGMRVIRNRNGTVFVARPGTEGGEVGGEVHTNYYGAPPDPEPDEISVLDGYDTAFNIRSTLRDEQIQLAEARRLFDEIIERLPWPALLVHDLGILLAAWLPGGRLTEFPPGTTPDVRHQDLWAPHALPAIVWPKA